MYKQVTRKEPGSSLDGEDGEDGYIISVGPFLAQSSFDRLRVQRLFDVRATKFLTKIPLVHGPIEE